MSIKTVTNRITDNLLNDDFRQPFLIIVLSILLSVISLISAIPHFIDAPDNTYVLAILLSVCSFLSLVIILLTIFLRKYHKIWGHLLMAIIIALFGYCCWDGGPQGFIHIWVLLVPAFSFVVFGIYEGFIICIPTLILMILFFWTPLNDYLYIVLRGHADQAPSVDFKLRMTLVYLVALMVGFLAELLRHVAARRLKEFTDHYEYVSMHDSLTNMANQNLLARYLQDISDNQDKYHNLGCLFVDVDAFKNVNDSYGHLFGNAVLVKISEILSDEKNAFVCRWGGDEFVICMVDIEEDRLMRIGEKYRATISACSFDEHPDFHITVSIGAVILPIDESFNFNHVLDLADKANRAAKNKGKDNVSLARIKSGIKQVNKK